MVAYKIFELQKLDYYFLPIILEPSMIMLDGEGTCFASYEGILCEERNPNLCQQQAETYLKDYLNVVNVIWIAHGLPYDETKGRLDNIMCIVNSATILLSWTDNTIDDRYFAVKNCWDILLKATNVHGKKYKIIKIPLPKNDIRTAEDIKMIDFNIYHNRILTKQKLVTSYLNLYISNKIVIIPTFNDEESETKLLDTLAKTSIFSNKQIILFNARELILGKSSIHSLICHQPSLITNR